MSIFISLAVTVVTLGIAISLGWYKKNNLIDRDYRERLKKAAKE